MRSLCKLLGLALVLVACSDPPPPVVPPRCGDGQLDPKESCDDGNTDDSDQCTHLCIPALCGDGVVNQPAGVTEACDDGNRDPGDTCTNACTVAVCGDGVLRVGVEVCDDGNQSNTDGCTNACQPGACGDGFVQKGEACDDGNPNDGDGCLSTCVLASCGDGVTQPGEACDDGNSDPTDACTNLCQIATCGDGIVRVEVEACDDGNQSDTDGCTTACKLASCGDGQLQKGEACDDGNQDATDACLPSCVSATCGAGVTGPGEGCDDGNQNDHDNCVSTCQPAKCGDGVVHKGVEACDDGNVSDTDGCTATCKLASCGDGKLQQGEACDDGNQDDTDGCSNACLLPACGDGKVQAGEQCDDGLLATTGACVPGCKLAACGDGWVQVGLEACDGGATPTASSGCTSTCKLATCGDGLVQAGEQCDDGDQDNGDACTTACLKAVCGDGLVQAGVEACDDGNQSDNDGCLSACQVASCGDGKLWLGKESCDAGASPGGNSGCTATCKPASCGDGVVQAGEGCDDGNGSSGDGCLNTCVPASCGDGVVNLSGGKLEACDDGNQDPHDACLPACVPAQCGDGVLQLGVEACDDGNQSDTDGCTNACQLAACGDGIVQAGEGCDDGNQSDADGCTSACQKAVCGDGVVNVSGAATEVCDDGNQSDADGCLTTCVLATCGDGKVWAGKEACDDGNANDGDGCTTLCKLATCGDGVLQTGEACDDGNQSNSDTCLNTCVKSSCGDGFVQTGEQCDDGNAAQSDACLSTCVKAACGDGVVQLGVEACDDGNQSNVDGCTTACKLAACGDGIVQTGEACDDGNNSNGDGCLNSCVKAACGDGVVQLGVEACDDGNGSNADGCLANCTAAKCGDGKLWLGKEACDDGNTAGGDGCSADCKLPTCGNGVLEAGEQCDDGNALDTDACTTACLSAVCGDGVVWKGKEGCDDGNLVNSDGCNANCQPAECGNGIVESPEECDDGNGIATDGCLPNCLAATCGDGVVWSGQESCDDGNTLTTDACPANCKPAVCGDGFVLAGVEPCDDGNQSNADACLTGCKKASCGDGKVQAGVEVCDDGNTDNTDGCLINCTEFLPCKTVALNAISPATACSGATPSSVTLTGAGFLQVGATKPAVTYDGVPVTVTAMANCETVAFGQAVSCQTLTIAFPSSQPGATATGNHTIALQNPIGGSCPVTAVFSITGPPTITSVAPTPICEGTITYDIRGTNLAQGTVIDIGGAKPANVTFIDSTHLQATFLAMKPGTFSVEVSNGPNCGSTKSNAATVIAKPFLYFMDPPVTFSGISVQATVYASGLGDGTSKGKVTGVGVRLNGTGGALKPVAFTFNPIAPKTIAITVPAGLPDGAYEVVVNDNFTCAVTLANAFTVTSKKNLALASIDPPFVKQGVATGVTLNATSPVPTGQEGFQTGATVYFSNANLGIASPAKAVGILSAARLTAVVPATLPAGKYDVIVINPTGAVGVLAAGLSVNTAAPPVVDSIAPGSVPDSGSTVTITGSGFTAGAKVGLLCTANSTAAKVTLTPTAVTATSLTINTAGQGLSAGDFCVVRVNLTDGTYADFTALVVTSPSENLSNFVDTGKSMVTARRAPAFARGRATNTARFLYALGGDNGSAAGALNSMEAVALDAYGGIGDWRTLPTTLPTKRTLAGVGTIGRYLYLVGGNDGSTVKSDVWRAQILNPSDAPQIDGVAVDVDSSKLTAGVWNYRVAALMKVDDPRNPGGLTLPSDPISVRIPTGLSVGLRVTVSWLAISGVDKYYVYRSPTAGAAAGQEQLLAIVSGDVQSYQDEGIATQAGSPRVLGDLGNWKQIASMASAREGAGVTVARDPSTANLYHLYAALGRTTGSALVNAIEYLSVQLDANGSPTDAAAWKKTTGSPGAGRWMVTAALADNTVTNRFTSTSEAWIYLGSGANAAGNLGVDALDAAKVAAGGDLTSVAAVNFNFKSRWGYAGFVAANQIFEIGGDAGAPSVGGLSGQLCGQNGPCANPPALKNINAGIGLSTPRFLMGLALESGRIWVAGGLSTGNVALKTVESTVW
jgi:cysteine-rich repeat protein